MTITPLASVIQVEDVGSAAECSCEPPLHEAISEVDGCWRCVLNTSLAEATLYMIVLAQLPRGMVPGAWAATARLGAPFAKLPF